MHFQTLLPLYTFIGHTILKPKSPNLPVIAIFIKIENTHKILYCTDLSHLILFKSKNMPQFAPHQAYQRIGQERYLNTDVKNLPAILITGAPHRCFLFVGNLTKKIWAVICWKYCTVFWLCIVELDYNEKSCSTSWFGDRCFSDTSHCLFAITKE